MDDLSQGFSCSPAGGVASAADLVTEELERLTTNSALDHIDRRLVDLPRIQTSTTFSATNSAPATAFEPGEVGGSGAGRALAGAPVRVPTRGPKRNALFVPQQTRGGGVSIATRTELSPIFLALRAQKNAVGPPPHGTSDVLDATALRPTLNKPTRPAKLVAAQGPALKESGPAAAMSLPSPPETNTNQRSASQSPEPRRSPTPGPSQPQPVLHVPEAESGPVPRPTETDLLFAAGASILEGKRSRMSAQRARSQSPRRASSEKATTAPKAKKAKVRNHRLQRRRETAETDVESELDEIVDAEGEVAPAFRPIGDDDEAALEDDELSETVPALRVGAGTMEDVRIGDVVKMVPDRNSGETSAVDWLAIVVDQRGLKSTRQPVTNSDGRVKLDKRGQPRWTYEDVFTKFGYLYAPSDFHELKDRGSNPKAHALRCADELKYIGSNERVVTDHHQWFHTERVEKGRQLVFKFDDRYPIEVEAAVENGSFIGKRHPLEFIRHRSSSSRPEPAPPSFFFGDALDTTTALYVRTEFNFDRRDVDLATLPATKGTRRPAKRPKRETVARKNQQLLYPPLTFNKFGITKNLAYEPQLVQIFSFLSQNWYTVKQLVEKGLVGPAAENEPLGALLTDADESSASPELRTLSRQPIVRGGVFGLTGNEYLVTRAGELIRAQATVTVEAERIRFDEEAKKLIFDWAKWAPEVERRRAWKPADGSKMDDHFAPVKEGDRWLGVDKIPLLSREESDELWEWSINGVRKEI